MRLLTCLPEKGWEEKNDEEEPFVGLEEGPVQANELEEHPYGRG